MRLRSSQCNVATLFIIFGFQQHNSLLLRRFGTSLRRVRTLRWVKTCLKHSTIISLTVAYQALPGHYNAYWDYSSNFRPNWRLSSPTNASRCRLECRDVINFLSLTRVHLSRTIVTNPLVFFQLGLHGHPSI